MHISKERSPILSETELTFASSTSYISLIITILTILIITMYGVWSIPIVTNICLYIWDCSAQSISQTPKCCVNAHLQRIFLRRSSPSLHPLHTSAPHSASDHITAITININLIVIMLLILITTIPIIILIIIMLIQSSALLFYNHHI